MQDIQNRIRSCEKELMALNNETNIKLAEKKQTLEAMTEARDKAIRQYDVISMTAAHVLRKAEKVIHKQKRQTDQRKLLDAIDILSDHGVPDPSSLVNALTISFPIVNQMIQKGEISLKNKEERVIFSDPAASLKNIQTATELAAGQIKQCLEQEQALSGHPDVDGGDDGVRRGGTHDL
jgi:sugar-specific transcriptional regulator TrmB